MDYLLFGAAMLVHSFVCRALNDVLFEVRKRKPERLISTAYRPDQTRRGEANGKVLTDCCNLL